MLAEVVAHLRCPVCHGTLAASATGLRCPAGHDFDRAAQGYVNLLARPAAGAGDSAAMLDARSRFFAAGHFAPLAAALVDLGARHAATAGLLVDIGAGTGHFLARLLEALPGRHGLAVDLSKHAARRAARAHARMASIVADVSGHLPLADGSAALIVDAFAPRNPPEFRRVLRPDGALLLVTPAARHLAELREPLGLLDVDPDKDLRLGRALDPHFRREEAIPLDWPMLLDRVAVSLLVAMGPSSRHIAPATLPARLAALPAIAPVTASVRLQVCRPLAP